MNIINFEKLDSTNTYAKFNIDKLEDKTIVSATLQTAGRGRFTRSWVDLGTENIYMTFVLKPSSELLPVHANLTQYLCVTLCKQLITLGLQPKIKWPNDVLLNNKKVCGILAETVIKKGKLKGIVLGIGVNLNTSLEKLDAIDRPATSLNIELKHNVNKKDFMNELIENFFLEYEDFLQSGFKYIKNDYEKYSILNEGQQNIKLSIFNIVKEGEFSGFDDNGNLLLLSTKGKIEKINMGEIV